MVLSIENVTCPMSNRRCTACGCTELIKLPYIRGGMAEGYVGGMNLESFVCVECGHAELYATREQIEKQLKKQKRFF